MNAGVITFAGIVIGVAIIVIIALVAASFAKVDTTEFGLKYSHAAQKIDRETLYQSGRYYVGVGGEFIKYPKTVQELVLPVFDARTSDGLKISLEVSINYMIVPEIASVVSMFEKLGRHYDGFLARLSVNVIRDASAEATAFEYAMNRTTVKDDMEKALQAEIKEMGFELTGLQLLNVDFPYNFSSTLQNTLMLQQQVTQAEREKDAEYVAMVGEVDKANVTAAGILADAKAEATTITASADAEAESFTDTLAKEADAHLDMLNTTFASNKDDFVNWYWVTKISSAKARKSVHMATPDAFEFN